MTKRNRIVDCAVRTLTLCAGMAAVGMVASADEKTSFKNKHFDAPILLMVGDKPLNASAQQMYPSPAMYDVDGDGQVELVVGDIRGALHVYENKNRKGKGDPVWLEHIALKTADGEPIKVSNW